MAAKGYFDGVPFRGMKAGNLPRNPNGVPWSLPQNDLKQWHFGQPGRDPRNQGQGRPATAQQRKCMEAIQRDTPRSKLMKEFPAGMVRWLLSLQRAAEDPESKAFIQSGLLIRAILIAPKSHKPEGEAAKEPEIIEVRTGRIEAPMPGAPGDVPPPAEDVDAEAG